MIPDEFLEELKSRSDIAEIVGSYVANLKRMGRNHKACCPFHAEKTPSFIVSQDRQTYHCFGCGVGGGVIDFVMRIERATFPEAVEILAARAGMEVPRQGFAKGADAFKAALYDANKEAAAFYHAMLLSKEGRAAREYLKSRGVTKETVETFVLGFAPDTYSSLSEYLRGKGFDGQVLQAARLVTANGTTDMFRNRVIFPIHDVRGRVVGFGSRRLSDEDKTVPKYINTPETDVYVKGRQLFGLFASKDAIAKASHAVLVEGNVDVIMPYQHGITNIAASMGTALTSDQARLLKRYAKKVTVLYDGDDAGVHAAVRAVDILVEQELETRVARLPAGSDPDGYVRAHGEEGLRILIDAAQDFFDFKVDVLAKEHGIATPKAKDEIARACFSTLRLIGSLVVRDEYLRRLSQVLQVDEAILRREFAKSAANKERATAIASAASQAAAQGVMPHHERYVLRALLTDLTLRQAASGRVRSECFLHPLAHEIAKRLTDVAYVSCGDVERVCEGLPDEAKQAIRAMAVDEDAIDAESLKDSMKRVAAAETFKRFDELTKARDAAKAAGEDITPESLMELSALKRKIDGLIKGDDL
jgi:DNA primase